MKALLLIVGAVFVVTFLAAPTMGAGLAWDVGNGLGFAAFAGLLYLGITSYRRLDVRAHQILGYAVLAVTVAHALWFLLSDAAAIEFVKPGAPDYMWLGIVALTLLFLMITIAIVPDRLRVHRDYSSFRYWHRILAIAIVACSTYHIVVSGFYLASWYQVAILVLFAVAASFGRAYWIKLGQIPIARPSTFVVLAVLASSLFGLVRNYPT